MQCIGRRLWIVLGWLLWATSPAWSSAQVGAPAEHVIIISIDGLRPEFYLDEAWPAPLLQQMARSGTHAEKVRGVFPTVTYPSHTSVITGAYPSRHGVFYNALFEPGGQTGRWYWVADSIRVPTLWGAAKAGGLKTASLAWPASVGAEADFVIPERWPLDGTTSLLDELRKHVHPPGLLDELERAAMGRLNPETFGKDWLQRDDYTTDAAVYLIEEYRPHLLTVHLVAVDHFQHRQGREGPMVDRALAAVDVQIGRIVAAAERAGISDRTAFFVTGDHGFMNLHTRIAPNRWLAEAGLLEAAPDRGEWRAAFHAAGGAAFLHLRDKADLDAAMQVREVLDALPDEMRRLFRIVDRAELDSLGSAPDAAFAIAGKPGVYVTASATAPAVEEASGGGHGFLPDHPEMMTGLVAWGAGVAEKGVVPEMRLVDIAPSVANLLGLEFSAPDGELVPALFR